MWPDLAEAHEKLPIRGQPSNSQRVFAHGKMARVPDLLVSGISWKTEALWKRSP